MILMVEWDNDYHERTGKWRPLVEWKNRQGKINPEHPEYARRLKESMKKINPFCESCGTTYNLADPCIHHLPDGYINEQKRKDHNKKRRESKSNDTNAKQGVL
mgnify:CR=1 FL=1